MIPVPTDKTLLAAMRSVGIDWPSSCNAGTCGTCKVSLIGGDADHRDALLTEEEQAKWLLPCVSRGDRVLELGPA
ncbi:2Fe-2S iron-sulfur cluster-binding protein [Rhodococcus koreensis]